MTAELVAFEPAGSAPRPFRYLVPLRPHGSRPRLFLVHGSGGSVEPFRQLAAALGPEQRVVGIQSRGVDGHSEPHERIEAMADDYLDELLQLQPVGPYLLAGFSGGGVIAVAMAQRLRARGAAVPFVGVIDAPCPQQNQRGRLARTMVHFGELFRRGPRYPLGILKTKFARWHAARQAQRAPVDGSASPLAQRGIVLQLAFERAFFQHRVAPCHEPLWLFRAEVQSLGTRYQQTHDMGWAKVASDLRVEVCPGDHFGMCEPPHVAGLGARLRKAIDGALAGGGA